MLDNQLTCGISCMQFRYPTVLLVKSYNLQIEGVIIHSLTTLNTLFYYLYVDKNKILKCFTGPQGFMMGEADLMRSRDLGEKFECKSTSDETFQYLYYYMRNFCYLIGLERWFFSLIWNIYMLKLQTFAGSSINK